MLVCIDQHTSGTGVSDKSKKMRNSLWNAPSTLAVRNMLLSQSPLPSQVKWSRTNLCSKHTNYVPNFLPVFDLVFKTPAKIHSTRNMVHSGLETLTLLHFAKFFRPSPAPHLRLVFPHFEPNPTNQHLRFLCSLFPSEVIAMMLLSFE